MSQNIFDDINPTTTSGTELATLLNEFKDAVVSGFSGTSRPVNLQAGGYWVDTTNDPAQWQLFLYDGSQDILLFTLDLTTGTASISGGGELLTLSKASNDILAPILRFLKTRAGGAQTLDGDNLAQIEFAGNDSGSIERAHARINVQATDNTSSTTLGSYITLEQASEGSGSLNEIFRIRDRKLGWGEINPVDTFHLRGVGAQIRIEREEDSVNSSTIVLQKKRLAGNGQVLINDAIGRVSIESADQNGTEFEAANMEVVATENNTDTGRGNKIVFKTIAIGDTVLTERLSIDENGVNATNLNVTNITSENVKAQNISDSVTAATFIGEKQRVSGLGQVLINDGILKLQADSTDVDGDQFESAAIEVFALEDHTNIARGTQIRFSTIPALGTALTQRLTIDETSTFDGNLIVTGNFTVQGTLTSVDSTELEITDANVTVNKGGTQASADLNDAGFTVEMSDATDAGIGYDSTLASKFKIGEVGSESEIADVSSAQTFTNKTLTSPVINTGDINNPDIDGGTVTGSSIETPTRSDVKQDTQANLETYALTATNGQLAFATDTKKMFQVLDNALSPVGGGGLGGGVDVYFADNFEDTEAADFETGNGVSLSGGTLQGTLADAAGTIEGDNDILYTQAAGSLNDFFFAPALTLLADHQGKGKQNQFIGYVKYTGNDDDMELIAYDATNSVVVAQELIKVSTLAQRLNALGALASTTASLKIGFRTLVENIGATLRIGLLEANTAPVSGGLQDSQFLMLSGANGYGSTGTEIRRFDTTVRSRGSGLFREVTTAANGTSIEVLRECTITFSRSDFGTSVREGGLSLNASSLNTDIQSLPQAEILAIESSGGNLEWGSFGYSETFQPGDIIRPHDTGFFTATSTAFFSVSAVAVANSFSNNLAPNEYSAVIDKTGGASIVSQKVPGVFTVTSGGSGRAILDYSSLGLTAVPVIVITSKDGNVAVEGTTVRSVTTTTASLEYINNSGGYEDKDFMVILSKQYPDSNSTNMIVNPAIQTCTVVDEKVNGAAGGTGAVTTWTPRDLNTIYGTPLVRVVGNQVFFPEGRWRVKGFAPFRGSDSARLRLYNATTASVIPGSYGFVPSQGANVNVIGAQTPVVVFDVPKGTEHAVELEYFINQSISTFDLGRNNISGTEPETYAIMDIDKLL